MANILPPSPRADAIPPFSPRSEEKKNDEITEDDELLKEGMNTDTIGMDDQSIGEDEMDGMDGAGVSFDLESSIEDAIVLLDAPVPITERDATEEEEKASVKMQGLARMKAARDRVRGVCREQFEQVFDNDQNRYFYFNSKTGESLWEKVRKRKAKVLGKREGAAEARSCCGSERRSCRLKRKE